MLTLVIYDKIARLIFTFFFFLTIDVPFIYINGFRCTVAKKLSVVFMKPEALTWIFSFKNMKYIWKERQQSSYNLVAFCSWRFKSYLVYLLSKKELYTEYRAYELTLSPLGE